MYRWLTCQVLDVRAVPAHDVRQVEVLGLARLRHRRPRPAEVLRARGGDGAGRARAVELQVEVGRAQVVLLAAGLLGGAGGGGDDSRHVFAYSTIKCLYIVQILR